MKPTRKPRTNLINRAEFYELTGRLQHFACFDCRKAFKKPFHSGERYICPQCRQPMTNMGTDFKAPAQKDVQQRRKVQALADAGVRFFPAYPDGLPGKRPAILAEVPAFLHEFHPPSAGERMLESQARRTSAPREGRLKIEGRFPSQEYSLLGVPLESGDGIELFEDGQWREVTFIARGSGGVTIPQPYVFSRQESMTCAASPLRFIELSDRLRWPQ